LPKSKIQLIDESEKLYERFGKPLEKEHCGEFAAVFPDGRSLVGVDLEDVSNRALSQFGKGSFVFKIGEKAVGKFR